MNTKDSTARKASPVHVGELRAAALYPITTRDAAITHVQFEVRGGVVMRMIGEIQILPESGRTQIVLGIGIMPHEREAARHNAIILPHQLLRDTSSLWNAVVHRRLGERMLRTALWMPAQDPLLQLELEQLIDTNSEVHA